MKTIETKRLILRPFTEADSSDVHEVALDWAKAPGPAFDKWPTAANETRDLTDYFAKHDKYYAVCLRDPKKVVGLLALNDVDTNKQLDMGHVILSKYQDNDLDKEALAAMVDYVFKNRDVLSIVTRNDPNVQQLASLKALGFKNRNKKNQGELVLSKTEWEQKAKK